MKTPAEAAKAWYNKAKTEHDCFDRFVYQWFAINILFSPYIDDNERRAIKNYIHDNWRSIDHLEDLLDVYYDPRRPRVRSFKATFTPK